MSEERMEVQGVIEAEPAAIFAVVSDPQGHVAIEDLAPPGWSYVFTSYVVEDTPSQTLGRRQALAAARECTYLPALLHCADDERRRRVVGGRPRRPAHVDRPRRRHAGRRHPDAGPPGQSAPAEAGRFHVADRSQAIVRARDAGLGHTP